MWLFIVGIIVIGTIAAGASLLWDKDKVLPVGGDCGGCSVDKGLCERECLVEAASEEIVYFNDEELDVYKGRASDSYSVEEVEVFREVMESLSGEELKVWNRSLHLRGIEMPNELKDEYILLIEGAE